MATFVSVTTGTTGFNVTVAAGSDRLLVICVLGSASVGARTVTYGGVSCTAATTSNGFTQIFYLLNATVGTASVSVSGGSISQTVAAQYTGVGKFENATQGSVSSFSVNPSAAAVICMGADTANAGNTPLTGTNERSDDNAGDWYGDRIVTGTGSVTVGVNTATSPDSAAAWFTDAVDASGAVTAPIATVSGSANTSTLASGAVTAPMATASGTATIQVAASGAVTAPIATASGNVNVIVAASGAVVAPRATVSGSESLAPVNIAGAIAPPLFLVAGAGGVVATPRPTARGSVGVNEPFAHVRVPGRPQGSVTED